MTMIQTNCSNPAWCHPNRRGPMYAEITLPRSVVSKERSSPVTTETSDDELLQGVAAGQTLAMPGAVRAPPRCGSFASSCGTSAMRRSPEELTGDVFLDVWRQADRFEGRSAVTTWLLSIARLQGALAAAAPVG